MPVQAKAQLRHLRIAPRKVRLIADLIRGQEIKKAQSLLEFNLKKSAQPVKKLLDTALANAKNNLNLEESSLVISEIFVDEGPKLKRWRARSRGRAAQIQKKTSHVTIILKGERVKGKKVEKDILKTRVKTRVEKEGETAAKEKAADEEKKEKEGAKLPEKKEISSLKERPVREKKIRTKPLAGLKKVFRRKSF